jgi:hypothetical protein
MCGQVPMALDNTATTAGDGKIAASRTTAGSCASRDNLFANPKTRKKPGCNSRAFDFQRRLEVSAYSAKVGAGFAIRIRAKIRRPRPG